MSILVIGVNHRSGPLALLERVTLAPDAIGKAVVGLADPRQRPRGRGAEHVQPHRGVRGHREVPRRVRRHPRLPVRHRPPGTRRAASVPVRAARRRRRRASVRGRVRARLGRHRRERDPRPGPPGVGDRAVGGRRPQRASTCCSATRSASASAPAPRPGSAAAPRRSATPRSRWPSTCSVASRASVCSSSAPAPWARVSPSRCTAPGRARSSSPTVSAERGSELADRVGGVAIGFDRLGAAIGVADLVLTCTGAGEPILTVDFLASARPSSRPLLIVDIAVPRDVEAAVTELPNVRILDLDDLRDWADRGRSHRMVEAERVREIIREEVERFASRSPRCRPRRSSPRCATTPRPSGPPSSNGSRRDWPSSTTQNVTPSTRSRAASSPSSCTSRRCGSSSRPARHKANATPPPWSTFSTSVEPAVGTMRPLRLATRGSAQATTQAELVAAALRQTGVDVELTFVETSGDVLQHVPLHSIGGQGVFVKEVQLAVLDGRADLAVHSAKDLRSTPEHGLVLAAFCERRTAADALVGSRLDRHGGRGDRRHRVGAAAAPDRAGPPRPAVRGAARQHPDPADEDPRRRRDRDGRRRPRDPRPHRPDRRDPRSGRVRPGRRPGMRGGRMPHRRR